MKSRLARLCALLLLIMGLVVGTAPPAHSLHMFTLKFNGFATVGNGIAYPCLGGKGAVPPATPTVETTKCDPTVMSNSAGLNLQATGVGELAKIIKLKCNHPPDNVCARTANYNIASSGMIRGYCGSSRGMITGTITQNGVVVNNEKPALINGPITFSFSFEEKGGVAILTGTADRGGNIGTLEGKATWAIGPGVPGSAGTCFNKASKTFVVDGTMEVTWASHL